MKKKIIIAGAAVLLIVLVVLIWRAGIPKDGDFSASLLYQNTELKSWQSDDGTYYLFLPGDVSIPELSFSCSGIRVKKVDRGSFDPKSGDTVVITSENLQKYSVVVMQAELPSVLIALSEASLNEINLGLKDTSYRGNTVTLVGQDGSSRIYEDVKLKGRGNTSWEQATKKSYQLNFGEKTEVFGMKASKKWLLQANAFDETMMRNEIAFRTSRKLDMPFTTDYIFANVWADGEYIGTYAVGEKVEIGSGRLELSDPQGILVEMDRAYYDQNQYWIETGYDLFGVKESVSEEEEDIEAAIRNFSGKYEALCNCLEETDPDAVTLETLSEYIDVDSFVKMFFLLEFFRNTDAYLSSTYFYQDGPGDVIHFGPVWDYDCSMGNAAVAEKADPFGNDYRNGQLISMLLETDAFSSEVSAFWHNSKGIFEESTEECDRLYRDLTPAADMNYTRWEYAFGQDHSPNYGIKRDVAAFHETWQDGYLYLKNWLTERMQAFDSGIL